MLNVRKCIVCGSDSFTPIYNNTLIKCISCGFISANMEVDADQIKEIYNEYYFRGNEYLNYLGDKQTIQKNFTKRLKQIQKDKNIRSDTMNILEIGCAYGYFLEVFQKMFTGAKHTGIDIVPEAINYGKTVLNLNLVLGDYLKFQVAEKYSHVFMWDVIEHLPRPDLFIEKISGETVKGGELYITTGDISAFLPGIQKSRWRMIHPPSHIHYFSRKTLTLLLKNYGFKIKKIINEPVYRSVRQIFYSFFLLKEPNNRFYGKILKMIPESWFVPINTFDIMYVIAVKQ